MCVISVIVTRTIFSSIWGLTCLSISIWRCKVNLQQQAVESFLQFYSFALKAFEISKFIFMRWAYPCMCRIIWNGNLIKCSQMFAFPTATINSPGKKENTKEKFPKGLFRQIKICRTFKTWMRNALPLCKIHMITVPSLSKNLLSSSAFMLTKLFKTFIMYTALVKYSMNIKITVHCQIDHYGTVLESRHDNSYLYLWLLSISNTPKLLTPLNLEKNVSNEIE